MKTIENRIINITKDEYQSMSFVFRVGITALLCSYHLQDKKAEIIAWEKELHTTECFKLLSSPMRNGGSDNCICDNKTKAVKITKRFLLNRGYKQSGDTNTFKHPKFYLLTVTLNEDITVSDFYFKFNMNSLIACEKLSLLLKEACDKHYT